MKKITIITLLLLSTVLWSGMFDQNTDVKSKYEFDIDIAEQNGLLSARLEKFKSGEASEEEISRYLKATDNNKTAAFADDVLVDASLNLQGQKEKGWFSSMYDAIFGENEEDVIVEETPVDISPEKGVE